jgi:CRISPR-associated protein Cas5h
MKIFSFYLKGKMAHFRKYYSNSTALSYYIPPRTTVTGIIAGLIGYERDTYYQDFSLDKCDIAIAICSPLKKVMQKLNYLMIKGKNDFNGSQENHSQTNLEFIVPQNIRDNCLCYQIWVHHKDDFIMKKIVDICRCNEPIYLSKGISLGLGTAFNLGWIEPCGIFEGEQHGEGIKMMNSIIPMNRKLELIIDDEIDEPLQLIKEKIPAEFDNNREITQNGLNDVLVNLNGTAVKVKINQSIELNNGTSIVWIN